MARRYRDRTDKFRVRRDPDVQTARIYFVCPVKMFTVSLICLVDEDHLRHHRIANSALSKVDHVDDMSNGVVDEPQRSSNMILMLRGRRLFEVCLATRVEFARCLRSDPTVKHLQRCNTHARFFTVLEGILVFTAGPQCDWFSVEDVVRKSNIEDVGPTRGP